MFSKNNFLWLGIFFVGGFGLSCFCNPLVMQSARSGADGSIVVLLVYIALWLVLFTLCLTGARRKWLDAKPDDSNPPDGKQLRTPVERKLDPPN